MGRVAKLTCCRLAGSQGVVTEDLPRLRFRFVLWVHTVNWGVVWGPFFIRPAGDVFIGQWFYRLGLS